MERQRRTDAGRWRVFKRVLGMNVTNRISKHFCDVPLPGEILAEQLCEARDRGYWEGWSDGVRAGRQDQQALAFLWGLGFGCVLTAVISTIRVWMFG
jgi:hypothetical protein